MPGTSVALAPAVGTPQFSEVGATQLVTSSQPGCECARSRRARAGVTLADASRRCFRSTAPAFGARCTAMRWIQRPCARVTSPSMSSEIAVTERSAMGLERMIGAPTGPYDPFVTSVRLTLSHQSSNVENTAASMAERSRGRVCLMSIAGSRVVKFPYASHPLHDRNKYCTCAFRTAGATDRCHRISMMVRQYSRSRSQRWHNPHR